MATNTDRPIIYVKLHAEGKKGEVLDISDRILTFCYEDEEKKADRLEISVDNYDMSQFDNPAWKKGGILEVRWGYPGNMSPTRSVVIQKISGNYRMKIEAHGLEMLMHKAKTLKVYKGKTLYEIATEVSGRYKDALSAYQDTDQDVVREKKTGGFDAWYADLAKKFNLVTDPDAKRHFYNYRALYRDVVAGKVPQPTKSPLPDQYRQGAPAMWVRDFDGNLVDARTNQPISDEQVNAAVAAHPVSDPGEEKISNEAKLIKITHAAQSAETDAMFLSKLAQKYGYVFSMDHNGFQFKTKDAIYKKAPEKVLTWFNGAGEWIDFSYDNSALGKAAKVKLKAVDPLNKKTTEVEGSDDATKRLGLGSRVTEWSQKTGQTKLTDRSPKSLQTDSDKAEAGASQSGGTPEQSRDEEVEVGMYSGSDPAHAKVHADGKYKKGRRHAHGLSGRLVGDPQFSAKTVLKVEGIGRRLSGRWAVASVCHRIDKGGYTCDFKSDRDGDNGFGEKGQVKSKAKLNTEPPKTEEEKPKTETGQLWSQRTGQLTSATRDLKLGAK